MANNRWLAKAKNKLDTNEQERLELLADILLEIALEEGQDEAAS
ncbi:MAG: hypothetical protein U0516_01010 [Candidatus Saccharibacteria bacterium]